MKLRSVPSSLPNSTIHLDMSYNQIYTLRNRSLEYLMNLRFLDLSNNGLRQIELDAFKGLSKLTVMWLGNNMLTVNNICGNVFKNVKAIQNLRLDANVYTIKVITKLPNSEQSYKGKVQTHNYINRQNQSTTGKL